MCAVAGAWPGREECAQCEDGAEAGGGGCACPCLRKMLFECSLGMRRDLDKLLDARRL
jgi:hypothetical protein